MAKFLSVFALFLCLNSNFVFARVNTFDCSGISSRTNVDIKFLEAVRERVIAFAFDDGDVHHLSFNTNSYGFTVGEYKSAQGDIYESNLIMDFIRDVDGNKFLCFIAPNESGVGNYKNDFFVLVPMTEDFLSTGTSLGGANLRWGRNGWREVRLFLL